MIPADHITIDGNTAWLICPNEYMLPSDEDWLFQSFWRGSDRPCDTCQGTEWSCIVETDDGDFMEDTCPDCIDGRHTFNIQVAFMEPPQPGASATYRVSVVMVLPIYGEDHEHYDSQWVESVDGDAFRFWWDEDQQRHRSDHVTLPPAATPGMWAVRLQVLS